MAVTLQSPLPAPISPSLPSPFSSKQSVSWLNCASSSTLYSWTHTVCFVSICSTCFWDSYMLIPVTMIHFYCYFLCIYPSLFIKSDDGCLDCFHFLLLIMLYERAYTCLFIHCLLSLYLTVNLLGYRVWEYLPLVDTASFLKWLY